MKKPKSDYAIQTVTNALRLLDVFREEEEVGVAALARRLGLHKNNVFRLLATLEEQGYIEQSPATERYRLGIGSLELGHSFLRSRALLARARPILEALCEETGESVHLGLMHGALHGAGQGVVGTRPGEPAPVLRARRGRKWWA
jgi:DNA-binding IclR family transcriptional regulator